MAAPVDLVVFDVNETLSDLAPLRDRFEDLGAPGALAGAWFAGVLRDGFALAVGGTGASFAAIAEAQLREVLRPVGLDRPTGQAVAHVMDAFASLEVHPDVADGVRALRRAGLRLVTLSNGAASIAESLLRRAGLREEFERVLSVDEAGIWKPARAAYAHALDVCEVPARHAALVAVHPWDVDGAQRAGLLGVWVNRAGADHPAHFRAPDVEAATLVELAARWS